MTQTEQQTVTTDQAPQQLAEALRNVTNEFESMKGQAESARSRMESLQWSGLEAVGMACELLDRVRDPLGEVARKINDAGQVLREKYTNNQMVGEKGTVTEHSN